MSTEMYRRDREDLNDDHAPPTPDHRRAALRKMIEQNGRDCRPGGRRLVVALVRLNWASLGIMAAIAVAGLLVPIILAWLPMTVVICTVWTMLRVTIDSKDTAPPATSTSSRRHPAPARSGR